MSELLRILGTSWLLRNLKTREGPIPMDLKKLIRAVAPPFLVDVYRRLKSPHLGGYLWRGIYTHYREVPAIGDGYNGDVWINSRTAYTKRLIDDMEGRGTIPVTLGFRYSSLALLAALVLESKSTVRVLDFGGAMGFAYPQLIKSLVSDSVEYFVVDNERSCEKGASLFNNDPRIHFQPQLDDNIPNVDIVFMSGVLQYIEDYRGVIHSLVKYHPTYFLYTYTSAGDIPTYASAQRNLRGSILPAWFFNIDELCAIMTEVGYRLIFKASVAPEDKLDMSNFPSEYRLHHMANLLFSKQWSHLSGRNNH
jgi:putative methyltransferase (TIGR04325 family)